MFRFRRVERVARIRRADLGGLRHQLVLEEFVEAGRAELERVVRRPVEAEVVAEVLLRLQPRVVAVLAVRKDEQVADLRRAVTGGDTRAELPLGFSL